VNVLGPLLDRAARRLAERLGHLETRLEDGDQNVWQEFRETAAVLASLLAQRAAERPHDALLSTRELAERMNVSSKTVLRLKAKGQIRPALQLGKRGRVLRWKDEVAG